MSTRTSTLFLAGLLAAACAGDVPETEPATENAADEAAIEQIRSDYVAHYNQHHASIVADLYADSAFGLMADGTVTMGKSAILADLEEAMAGSPTLELETGDVMVFVDNAVSRGTYNVSTTTPDSATMSLGGNYLTHFTRVNGEWKINGVVTNFNAPPPEGFTFSQAEDEAPPDEGTMGALADAYTQAFRAGDWAALAQLYTNDAVAAFSETPAVEGTSAIQARFADRFGETTERQIEIHDVGTLELAPGWALDGGWYTLSATTAAGAVAVLTGTYMNVLQQQPDGSWKIHWAVSNAQPAPAM